MKKIKTQALVIGTGLGGCSAALALADRGVHVLLVTRAQKPHKETATAWAQGGIVYKNPKEKKGDLVKDILKASSNTSNIEVAELLEALGPKTVKDILIDRIQVPFVRKKNGDLDLTGEAAHRFARILYHGDTSGESIEKAFIQTLEKHPNVEFLTAHTAIDLLTLSHHSEHVQDQYKPSRCVGAFLLNQKNNQVVEVLAHETILATGGLGQLYLHTTNPLGARGDGLSMAYRTGARLMNLEYIQFHPTTFFKKGHKRFLLTEALRGEGAKLINESGEAFMKRYHKDLELAPRDIVSRAIHDELLRTQTECVYLDISFKPKAWIEQRFPWIYNACQEMGVDMSKVPVPVVPSAHYACGGVFVDTHGNTTLENLKAVGEVSCTGLHGANRLASTSLLEDLVFGIRAGEHSAKTIHKNKRMVFPKIRPWESQTETADPDLLQQDWLTIKHTMWNYVGLIRTPKHLNRAQRILRELSDEIGQFYSNCALTDTLIGLRNGVQAAQLVLTAAGRNLKSVGCHFIKTD